MVLAEVRRDVVVGVDRREVDPRAIGGCRVIRWRDVRADRGDRERVTAGDAVGGADRETQRTERRDDGDFLRARRERDGECSGFGACFDRELGLGLCGGLGIGAGDWFLSENINFVGAISLQRDISGSGGRGRGEGSDPREWDRDDEDVYGDEREDQSTSEWRAR